ncbi:MAG: hypothetical protein HQL29_05055 [Candidatus Omnitrophica bacterium]|nr:hypothetical protein [Candidatus Omnitrophota bacterium]
MKNIDQQKTKQYKGLDVGTMNLIGASDSEGNNIKVKTMRHVFLEVSESLFMKNTFKKQHVKYVEINGKIYLLGDSAFTIAKQMNTTVHRPMQAGILNNAETVSEVLLNIMIESLIGRAKNKEDICCYSIPSDPIDADFNVLYHKGIIAQILEFLGYTPIPLKEGLAVVFSELADKDFTGLGFSFGGGMINVCFAHEGKSVLDFSSIRGGDWIDRNVALNLGFQQSMITGKKETTTNIHNPHSSIDRAFRIYFSDVFQYIFKLIEKESRDKIKDRSLFSKGIDIACSGGSILIPGFLELFKKEISKASLPFTVNDIRLVKAPLETTAKGCYMAATIN